MAKDSNTALKCAQVGKSMADTHISSGTVEDLSSTANVIMGYATQAAVLLGARFAKATAPYLEPNDPDFKAITKKYWQEFMSSLGEKLAEQTQIRLDELNSQGDA